MNGRLYQPVKRGSTANDRSALTSGQLTKAGLQKASGVRRVARRHVLRGARHDHFPAPRVRPREAQQLVIVFGVAHGHRVSGGQPEPVQRGLEPGRFRDPLGERHDTPPVEDERQRATAARG